MVREKSKKVTDSHRKDMSPLIQGLNYRSACDIRGGLLEMGRWMLPFSVWYSRGFAGDGAL